MGITSFMGGFIHECVAKPPAPIEALCFSTYIHVSKSQNVAKMKLSNETSLYMVVGEFKHLCRSINITQWRHMSHCIFQCERECIMCRACKPIILTCFAN